MSDSDKSIQRQEPSPYEKIIVSPIEKDKKGKEEGYTGLKGTTRPQTLAVLLSYFKKILTSLSPKGRGAIALGDEQQLLDHIVSFRKLLLILASDDQSHNPEFTEQLSEIWHNLLDDSNTLSYQMKTTSETLAKTQFFLSQVQHYPPSADHTLGYYFTMYAGKDWLPFPFMGLLQQLHQEHSASPEDSTLKNWLSLLNDILSSSGFKLDQEF